VAAAVAAVEASPALAATLRRLTDLDVSEATFVTPHTLVALLTICNNLKRLGVSGCRALAWRGRCAGPCWHDPVAIIVTLPAQTIFFQLFLFLYWCLQRVQSAALILLRLSALLTISE
jgi:hypothetical protein